MNRILFLSAVAFAAVANAAVTLPHVFGDNMVLQRGQKVPVWGKADPGERVTGGNCKTIKPKTIKPKTTPKKGKPEWCAKTSLAELVERKESTQ